MATIHAQVRQSDVADPFAAAEPQRGHALLSVIAGERATQGPGNKIVTFQGKTHVAWQDSCAERYFARVRTLDHATGQWSASPVLAEGVDEHSRPTLAIDSHGFLHMVMGGHNTPLQYQRTLAPHDSTRWSEPEPFGKNTYPVLLCGPDDTLHLTCRSGDHAGMEQYTKAPDGSWASQGLVVARQARFSGYTAMHNDMAWGPGRRTLHMSMGFFLSPDRPKEGEHMRDVAGRYQAVGYLCSDDQGQVWRRRDGSTIALPANSDSVDRLDEGESDRPKPGIQHCGLAVDSKNRPYVGYVRHTPSPCQAFLLTSERDGRWRHLPMGEVVSRAWPGWGVLGFKPVMTADDVLCILATLVPLDHPAANWNPGVYGHPAFWLRDHTNLERIVWLESRDFGQSFSTREVLQYDPNQGQVMPTIERPNGPNAISAAARPSFMYTLGVSRYAEEGETIHNQLYWVRVAPDGPAD